MKELQKYKMELENMKRQLLQQEIKFNIQKTEALTRYLQREMSYLPERYSEMRIFLGDELSTCLPLFTPLKAKTRWRHAVL